MAVRRQVKTATGENGESQNPIMSVTDCECVCVDLNAVSVIIIVHLLNRKFNPWMGMARETGVMGVGLPGVRFLTGQSGFLAICPVKNMMLNWTISCPVLADLENWHYSALAPSGLRRKNTTK